MSNQQLSLAVIISAFSMDRCEDVVEAVRALEKQTAPPEQLAIVVDANPELLAALQDQLRASPLQITYCHNAIDRGLSHSRNIGLAATNSSIVSYIDDDAVPAADWCDAIRKAFADPEVVAVAGWIDPRWSASEMEWFPRSLFWMISCTYTDRRERRPIRNGFGANMAFRRSALSVTGAFREDLGLRPGSWTGGEDTEMFIRIASQGKVLLEPDAVVEHKILPQRLLWSSLRRRAVAAGRSMAMAKRAMTHNRNSYLSDERGYLKNLLLRDFATEVRRWIHTRRLREARRPAAIIAVVWWTGLGYIRESLAPARVG